MDRDALGTKEGLSPGHIVLDGDSAPPNAAQLPPNFRPMSVVAKRLVDQDATWYGGRLQCMHSCGDRAWQSCAMVP